MKPVIQNPWGLVGLAALIFLAGCAGNRENEWKDLVKGNSLDGWTVKCVEADKELEFFSVKDGILIANSLGNDQHDYYWLMSDEEYGDFELSLKFQTIKEAGGNSGIQIRSRYDEKAETEVKGKMVAGWLDGPQVDINPPAPFRNGLIYDETRGHRRWICPSLESYVIDSATYAVPGYIHYHADEGPGWNEMTLLCKGTQIKTIVNGVVICDYDGSGILNDEYHEKYKVGMKGHIALQIHRFNEVYVRFRDIRIREL